MAPPVASLLLKLAPSLASDPPPPLFIDECTPETASYTGADGQKYPLTQDRITGIGSQLGGDTGPVYRLQQDKSKLQGEAQRLETQIKELEDYKELSARGREILAEKRKELEAIQPKLAHIESLATDIYVDTDALMNPQGQLQPDRALHPTKWYGFTKLPSDPEVKPREDVLEQYLTGRVSASEICYIAGASGEPIFVAPGKVIADSAKYLAGLHPLIVESENIDDLGVTLQSPVPPADGQRPLTLVDKDGQPLRLYGVEVGQLEVALKKGGFRKNGQSGEARAEPWKDVIVLDGTGVPGAKAAGGGTTAATFAAMVADESLEHTYVLALDGNRLVREDVDGIINYLNKVGVKNTARATAIKGALQRLLPELRVGKASNQEELLEKYGADAARIEATAKNLAELAPPPPSDWSGSGDYFQLASMPIYAAAIVVNAIHDAGLTGVHVLVAEDRSASLVIKRTGDIRIDFVPGWEVPWSWWPKFDIPSMGMYSSKEMATVAAALGRLDAQVDSESPLGRTVIYNMDQVKNEIIRIDDSQVNKIMGLSIFLGVLGTAATLGRNVWGRLTAPDLRPERMARFVRPEWIDKKTGLIVEDRVRRVRILERALKLWEKNTRGQKTIHAPHLDRTKLPWILGGRRGRWVPGNRLETLWARSVTQAEHEDKVYEALKDGGLILDEDPTGEERAKDLVLAEHEPLDLGTATMSDPNERARKAMEHQERSTAPLTEEARETFVAAEARYRQVVGQSTTAIDTTDPRWKIVAGKALAAAEAKYRKVAKIPASKAIDTTDPLWQAAERTAIAAAEARYRKVVKPVAIEIDTKDPRWKEAVDFVLKERAVATGYSKEILVQKIRAQVMPDLVAKAMRGELERVDVVAQRDFLLRVGRRMLGPTGTRSQMMVSEKGGAGKTLAAHGLAQGVAAARWAALLEIPEKQAPVIDALGLADSGNVSDLKKQVYVKFGIPVVKENRPLISMFAQLEAMGLELPELELNKIEEAAGWAGGKLRAWGAVDLVFLDADTKRRVCVPFIDETYTLLADSPNGQDPQDAKVRAYLKKKLTSRWDFIGASLRHEWAQVGNDPAFGSRIIVEEIPKASARAVAAFIIAKQNAQLPGNAIRSQLDSFPLKVDPALLQDTRPTLQDQSRYVRIADAGIDRFVDWIFQDPANQELAGISGDSAEPRAAAKLREWIATRVVAQYGVQLDPLAPDYREQLAQTLKNLPEVTEAEVSDMIAELESRRPSPQPPPSTGGGGGRRRAGPRAVPRSAPNPVPGQGPEVGRGHARRPGDLRRSVADRVVAGADGSAPHGSAAARVAARVARPSSAAAAEPLTRRPLRVAWKPGESPAVDRAQGKARATVRAKTHDLRRASER